MYIRLYCDISNLLLSDCVYKIRQADRVKIQTDLLIGDSGLGCIIQGNREQKNLMGQITSASELVLRPTLEISFAGTLLHLMGLNYHFLICVYSWLQGIQNLLLLFFENI